MCAGIVHDHDHVSDSANALLYGYSHYYPEQLWLEPRTHLMRPCQMDTPVTKSFSLECLTSVQAHQEYIVLQCRSDAADSYLMSQAFAIHCQH